MIESEPRHNAKALKVEPKEQMSTKQKAKIEIRQDLLKLYVDRLPGQQAVAFQQAVEAANELVNVIENRVQTTQGFYGSYLEHATSLVNVAVFMCAGANKKGLLAAARINGLV